VPMICQGMPREIFIGGERHMLTCICPQLDIVYNCLTEQQVASAHAVPLPDSQRTRQSLQENVRGGARGRSRRL